MITTILSKLSGNEDVKVLRFPSFCTLICHRFRASTQIASALRFMFLHPILKTGPASLYAYHRLMSSKKIQFAELFLT